MLINVQMPTISIFRASIVIFRAFIYIIYIYIYISPEKTVKLVRQTNTVPTRQGNLFFLQGQGKVREFWKMVREFQKI